MPPEYFIQNVPPMKGYEMTSVDPRYTQQLAYNGDNLEYVGKAEPGSATSDNAWQIQRLTYSGSNLTAQEWAGGNREFKHVWDDRASLSYS